MGRLIHWNKLRIETYKLDSQVKESFPQQQRDRISHRDLRRAPTTTRGGAFQTIGSNHGRLFHRVHAYQAARRHYILRATRRAHQKALVARNTTRLRQKRNLVNRQKADLPMCALSGHPIRFPGCAKSGDYESSYPDVFSATNSFTAAASGSIAGSPSCRIWLRPGKPKNLAPGMPAANSTPNLNGTALSSRQ